MTRSAVFGRFSSVVTVSPYSRGAPVSTHGRPTHRQRPERTLDRPRPMRGDGTLISGGQGRCVMSYALRLHEEIRGWLTDLRDAEPELGRLVGEAIVALLD